MERIRNRVRGVADNKWMKFIIPGLSIFIILALVIVVFTVVARKNKEKVDELTGKTAENVTISCPGFEGEECEKMGCHYDPKVIKGPSCSMRKDSFGFKVENVSQQDDGPLLHLKYMKEETPYGPSFKTVTFKITYVTGNILRFQFRDAAEERYEVPVQFPLLQSQTEVNSDDLTYQVVHANESETFHFAVIRKKDSTVLWNTSLGALLLSDQFLQIGSYLPTSNIYGLGEHVHDTLRHNMSFVSWPMFARDEPPIPKKRANLYGVHPFYTCLEDSGASHGVLLLNSNAMEVMMLPAPGIIFRTIGGILDFFIFVGNNPEHVIQLYTSLIGRPVMPPYWSLGFQLSRYGYNTIENLAAAMNRTLKAKIPLAVQFLDIDHFDKRMDFTYDNSSFAGLPEYINQHKKDSGLKWIIILDPALAAVDNYEPYTSGLSQSVYVMRGPNWKPNMFPTHLRKRNITYGKVWPPDFVAFPDFFQSNTKAWWKDQIVKHKETINFDGLWIVWPPDFVAFPDFFQSNTKAWWKDQIVKHKETINFDGLWIDMNEPANFDTNENVPDECEEVKKMEMKCWNLKCPNSPLEDPPYNPQKESGFDRLSTKTLCMESVQRSDDREYRHYDVHSLYGWSQTQPTLEAAQEATGTRSLVISRSTYPSSGRYAGTWLGDNESTWKDLQLSIIGLLEYNMFGIPYVGADVCGFRGECSKDLCKRWMQLGAFYPFYRNHNAIDAPDQDPAYFGEEVAEISRKAVERRRDLNPYLYTLFYRAHKDGNTVVRPVFHEFPTDKNTWNLDKEFMWGKSLLIAPILHPNTTKVSLYLPKGEWWKFNYENTRLVAGGRRFWDKEADECTPVYVRGGSILPVRYYNPELYPEDGKNATYMNLYIFPEHGVAEGELFVDDGISKDTIENEAYELHSFKLLKNCTLKINTTVFKNFKGPQVFIEKIFIYKAEMVNKATYGHSFEMNTELQMATVIVQTGMNKLNQWSYSHNGACKMLE